jgi:hypothetical protein
MSNHRTRWREKREKMAQRGPWIRIDDVQIEPEEEGYGYRVTIRGVNFTPAIVPPRVTVGNQPLHDLTFGEKGREISGRLQEEPDSLRVLVEIGPARTTWPKEDEGAGTK